MIHWLKTEQPYFNEVWDHNKPFEVRKNDRAYQEGDILILAEVQRLSQTSSPRAVIARAQFVLDKSHSFEGVHEEYAVIGLHILARISEDDLTLFEYTTAEVTSRQWKRFERREPKEA